MGEDEQTELFKNLYDSTRARLFAYALRRTRSAEDAADVTAEVFTIAWQKRSRLPGDDPQILWLYAVARRVLANRYRKLGHQGEVFEKLRLEAKRSLSDSISPPLEESMLGAEVFARLKEPDREILMLSGWEGLNPSELGYTLECSPLAARIRLHRARARLTAALDAAGLSDRSPRLDVPDVPDEPDEPVTTHTEGLHES
jgi:RNA polymerase sigma-70 factor (ECF subfamily)